MAEVTILSQIAKIRSFEKGYWASHVINTGFSFGMLHALEESIEGLTVPELAVRLMLYEPYLKIWCQTAYHLEILDCDQKGRFRLQPFLAEVLGLNMLSRNDPILENQSAGIPRRGGNDSPLSEYIRTGRTVSAVKAADASVAAYRGTKSITTIFLSIIFPEKAQIKKKLEEGIKFLDIGCGSGSLIIDFAHIFKNSVFFGTDPDIYGIESAERSIVELGLENRVKMEHLGGEEIHYHEEFEMASMILTLHEILPELRVEVVSNTYKALKKGGQILILDYPYPRRLEDFRNPRYGYGIIEQYFEAPYGIVHISQEEQDDLLSRAGFKGIERIHVGDGGMLDFITAMK
jgi:ubiquinone/menaquinone biosynthesis C-methylase UbiE